MKSKADKATKLFNAIIGNVDDLEWEYEGTKYERLIEGTSELFAQQWVFAMQVWRAARELRVTDEEVVAQAAFEYADLLSELSHILSAQAQMKSTDQVAQ